MVRLEYKSLVTKDYYLSRIDEKQRKELMDGK